MGKIKSARKNYYSDTYIGYLPAYWLQKASKLKGDKTILVANLLWMFWSMKYLKRWLAGEKTQNVVFLNDFAAGEFGISPATRMRCLKRLADADLIAFTTYGQGKRPAVLIKFVNVRKSKDQP